METIILILITIAWLIYGGISAKIMSKNNKSDIKLSLAIVYSILGICILIIVLIEEIKLNCKIKDPVIFKYEKRDNENNKIQRS